MTGPELINQNISKKMAIAIAAILILNKANAPTWQVMTVALAAVVVQGILDFVEKRKE